MLCKRARDMILAGVEVDACMMVGRRSSRVAVRCSIRLIVLRVAVRVL